MSASMVAELADDRTGERIETEAAASEAEARRNAENLIRQKPGLRLIRIYQAAAKLAGEGNVTANAEVARLYDTDIALWAKGQAELLRLRAAGQLVNDADIDWQNVAEEIEDMGNNVVRGVASHLVQAILHDLKAEAWPLSWDAPNWRAEARLQRDEARTAFAPSMARRKELDVATLYRRALRGMPETIDEQPPLPVPTTCNLTLAELLAPEVGEEE